jgi:hypothetical protein
MSLIFSPDRQVSPESAVEDGTAWNLTLTFVRNGSNIFADRLSLRYVVQTGHLPFPWSIDASMTGQRHLVLQEQLNDFNDMLLFRHFRTCM